VHFQSAWQGKWIVCLGVSAVVVVLSYWPHGLAYFRYDRAALWSGQAWRVMTAHFVHLSTAHLVFNILGMFLLCELLWSDLPVAHGLGLLGSAIIGVSASLWWLQPELAWYAGLSGVLHGMWAGCALAGCWPGKTRQDMSTAVSSPSNGKALATSWPLTRRICAAGLMLLIVKLTVEFYFGGSPRTEQLIGGAVVTVAHLYGALTGVGYVLLWRIAQKVRFNA
jgi:rhomboid family GlyGly-CTERM serine protease